MTGGDEGKWWRREVVTMGVVRKGSGEEGKWWGRQVVTKGSGEEGKWWWRGVVTKGSGEEGKWWRREVVTKGSGEEGKWWWRGVVTKGSGEEGKWWRREAVKKGSDDEGEWWRREVVRKGSGDEGKWRGREVMMKGSGEEGNWQPWRGVVHDVARALFWGGSRSTKPCVFPCKVAAGDDERYLVCAAAVGLSFFLPQCNGGFKLLWVCLCVRSYRVFWNLCLQIALEWLHDVARALFWGGSWSTKPCVFPCKVAAGDDERYLVCAAGAAAVGLSFFFCRSVTVASSCFGCACVCVVIGCFGICACRSHWNGCMMLQGLCFGEEAGARNLVFFRVKWLQATMKGTSSVRRVRLRSVYRFFLPQCNGGFKLLWVCLCVRSYRVFWNLCLQIALEWLHDVARALFWGGSRSTKPCVFPCKVAAGDDERYLVCAAGAAAVGLSFFLPQCNGGFKLLWVCLCVRSYRVFWNLCLQIALDWLRQGCLPPRLHA